MKLDRKRKSNHRYPSTIAKLCFLFAFSMATQTFAQEDNDTIKFPIRNQTGGLFLDNQITYDISYDPIFMQYTLLPKIGNTLVGDPIILSRKEYLELVQNDDMKSYYQTKSRTNDQYYRERQFGDKVKGKEGSILPTLKIKSKAFETIFGGSEIKLIPQGYANLDLGVYFQNIQNPLLLPQNRKTFTMDLQQRMQLSILGKVGENLQLKVNYDTQAGFGFENQMKLQWRKALGNKLDPFGGEDDILQNIEVGNISMPLSTSLITGAQSLFGVRTDLKFGRTNVSAVFSEQRSEARNISVQGGGVVNTFSIPVEKYEYNRHFFIGHYFRGAYDKALANYPTINSKINITRMEVWKVDRSGGNQENRRSIIALRDIGENGNNYPNRESNPLYNAVTNLPDIRNISTARSTLNGYSFDGEMFQDGENYIVNENVRKLDPSEYSFNPQLGYITLNNPVVDGEDLLAVAFQYTVSDDPTKIYKVGEMSDEYDKTLVTKLIKSNTAVNLASPMWDLLMKNIYSLNAFGIDSQDFRMNVTFKDNSEASSGTLNYLPNTVTDNRPLIQVLNMDRLNENGQPGNEPNGQTGDGIFDFVPGITIDQTRGSIIFTSVEPFGSYLNRKLQNQNPEYVFDAIYRKLPNVLTSEKLANRYHLEGKFKASGGDGISLGAFNVPQGSVKVTANGVALIEGVDYTVDYQLGRVKIINEQLKNSGAPINISLENQSTFNLQKKRFIGLNVEHRFSDKWILGGTLINYQERPLTQKVQFGSEPVNNTVIGLNTQYTSQSEFLTRITNKLPGVKTDQISNINFQAEGAYLLPGINKATSGYSYIDDFEDAQSRISLLEVSSWKFGSTPGRPAGYTDGNFHPFFPNGISDNSLSFNNGRRMMSWYSIDPRFYGLGGSSPISDAAISNHKSRRVLLRELFDQRDVLAGTNNYINTMDLTFYPDERGAYNVNPNSNDTKGWAAIMRPINVSNFIDANVEYMEFWMMDPYADNEGGEGELLIHLGNVSEDILKDGEMIYENGLPHSGNQAQVTETAWGKQPALNPILYTFDTDGQQRKEQDLGFNGLTDTEEETQYNLTSFNPVTGELDPANDNYLFYLDGRFNGHQLGETVTGRYRYFRNPQGNSSTTNPLEAASLTPDVEDINGDFNLDQTENYNQYTFKINRQTLEDVDNKFIVGRKESQVVFANGRESTVKWYQVRIPVDGYDLDINGDGRDDINEDQAQSVLSSARFMRMVMRGFDKETTIRLGTFDLVRSEWRKYPKNLFPYIVNNEEGSAEDINLDDLEIGEVNIEQNSTNRPPYRIPPGVYREQIQGTTGVQYQNEASMTLKATFKGGSTSKAVFKNVNLDLRRYKKLEMYVSAQDLLNRASANLDPDTKLFIRLGSDYTDNYYEYEMPLKYTSISALSESEIWPSENKLDVNTDLFTDAKKLRDTENYSTKDRFSYLFDDGNTNKAVYVKGRPTLGNVSSLMIGIRTTGGPTDKEVLLWVNELRLSEIDNEGGYAGAANLQFNLGDFANVQVSGSTSSVGFGAIDLGPSGRNQDETKEYAINAAVKLDKFLPKEWGLEIPFNVTMQERFIDPKYNPLDNDIEFDEAPNREELKKIVRTYSQYKSFAFNNVRKIRAANKKARFYDVSNFSLSMLYSNNYYRDIYTEYMVDQQLRASLNYNFQFKNKSFEPFKKWKAAQTNQPSSKYLQFIKEINFNPVPTRFSFRTDVMRTYSEKQYRDINQYLGGASSFTTPYFSNNFLFSWQYNIGFDLTKSLRLDLNAATTTLNDGDYFYKADQSLIWDNVFKVGRPINYDQRLQVNYKLPLKFFPYLSFMNMEVAYGANYNWQAYSLSTRTYKEYDDDGNLVKTQYLGDGVAQNSNSISLIGDMDFTRFYPEFKGYKRFDSIFKGRRAELDSLNNAYAELALKKNKRNNKKGYKFKNKYQAKDYGWMVLSTLKRINFNYNQTNGAVIPGLFTEPGFFGTNGNSAPTLGFIYGTQFDIKRQLVERGLISDSDLMTDPYQITKGTNFNATAQLEPIPNLRIDLSAKHTEDKRRYHTGFNTYEWIEDPLTGDLVRGAYRPNPYIDQLGNLNVSNINIGTAFTNKDQIFAQFIENSKVISHRLGGAITTGEGFADGYNITNPDVALPAFVAAVEGKNASGSSLGYNKRIPLPNWRISYTGLKSIPKIAKYVDQIELLHAYNSSYTVSSIQSNPNYYYALSNDGFVGKDISGNYYSKNIFGTVAMIESFSPLIGADVTFRNNMQIRAQYNRDRLLSLSLSNYTLLEEYGNEFIVGFGYIFKDFKVKMRYQGSQKTIKGDLNIRGDFSLRDNETIIRRYGALILDSTGALNLGDYSQITGGQKIVSVKLSADYSVSKNLNLKIYWDQMMSKYKISTAFPISQVRAGISATFTFGN